MTQAYFVTGTDTDVGKTHVACQLIEQYIALGLKVVGMKPVAAGCELVDGEWVNEDVQRLTTASNIDASPELVNPYCFKEFIAPHIAAEKAGITIQISKIVDAFKQLSAMADVVIVEGAGGFLVPLDSQTSLADLAVALGIPVVLVIGMRLGCINHSLLTVEAVKARGLELQGWIANEIDPEMAMYQENLETIAQELGMEAMFESKWVGST